MKKCILLAGTLVLLLSGAQIAKSSINMTDWNCMQDCLDKGYQYGYCKKMCQY